MKHLLLSFFLVSCGGTYHHITLPPQGGVWESYPITISIDQQYTETEQAQITSAINTWNSAIGITLLAVIEPQSPRPITDTMFSTLGDNQNHLYKGITMPTSKASVLGVAMWSSTPDNKFIESDIIINFQAHSMGNVFTGASFDLESVMLHELGHLLGLGHLDDSSTVMYAYMSQGQTKRTLTNEDINYLKQVMDKD